jgi:hypothetical protein
MLMPPEKLSDSMRSHLKDLYSVERDLTRELHVLRERDTQSKASKQAFLAAYIFENDPQNWNIQRKFRVRLPTEDRWFATREKAEAALLKAIGVEP